MKLSQIKVDSGLQMRAKMDQNTIDYYAERLIEGDKFPPVVLFHDGTQYHLADGWNRYFAHKKAAFEIINADVREGTRRDAIYYALSANARNGQNRTPDDKRKAVMTMLDDMEWSEKSDREIAMACVVSNAFVSRLRKSEGKQPETISIKRGDQEYKMANPAKEAANDLPQKDNPPEEDKIFEMATTIESLASDLEAAERRIAVAAMEATPEEKKLASTKLEEMAAQVKNLDENNRVLRISRDTIMNEASQKDKQINYWKKRAEKAEKELELLAKQMKVWKDRAETAEAHLAIDKAA
jgi:chromosome segregation ATPase